MTRRNSIVLAAVMALGLAAGSRAAQTVPLTALDLKRLTQDYGEPTVDKAVGGRPLMIGGKTFERGLGSHAEAQVTIAVNGATRFMAVVGMDDDVTQPGQARFRVIGDGKTLFDSGLMATGDAGKAVDVPLGGVKRLVLSVTAGPRGIQYAHADWADAQFAFDGVPPAATEPPTEPAEILTPPPPKTPRINGAKVFGVRPGSPVLFSVAATGERPMAFKAANLPDGVTLDAATGRFGGSVKMPGTYTIRLTATNALGSADTNFKLVVGDRLALTPLMGWNSWYGFADRVSDANIRLAADLLERSGLTEHGYAYVCIDDFWQQTPRKMDKDPGYGGPGRDAAGNIVPNPHFPDMHALADYIHSKGLKAGLYSSPGPFTCGGALGSYGHEAEDARQYADWGFDLLKYDWCSYKPELEAKRKSPVVWEGIGDYAAAVRRGQARDVRPYALMGQLLRQQNRDIFYLMCQYGQADSWNWGDLVGGQSARTTGDVTDTWGSVSGIGFGQVTKRGVSGPGFWGDPDMLMVGTIGLDHPHPSRLTPNEQYTQISLWSILPAPLLFGAHLDKLDDFTKSLLTNDEVIAVNQDPLGRQATRVSRDEDTEVWAKPLSDGTLAVALFNRGETPNPVTAKWADLHVAGSQLVHDLWRQKDVGQFADAYTATVPRHGVVFVKISKP